MIPPPESQSSESIYEDYEDDDELAAVSPDIEDVVDINGKLLNQQPVYDKLINAEVTLQLDKKVATGTVRRRANDINGQVIGTYDDNPFLNTMIYEVEFPDGEVREYGANLIAENMIT